MTPINNKTQLIENGESPELCRARRLALDSLEAALNAADPKEIIRSQLQLKDSTLMISDYNLDLRKFRHVYVVGGGKASGSMAEELEYLLYGRINEGIVNVPTGTKNKTRIIQLHEASHPIPDLRGVEGTRRMIEIAEKAEQDDLIICLVSGGGSSLMPLPRGKVTISDKAQITNALLKCGATVNEINTVRKHISDFKGGWLAKKAYPATILNLILSDVIGDPLDFIASGPTVPDSTTFTDAIRVLRKYCIWERTPVSIQKVLSDGEKALIPETPKMNESAFKKTHNVVIGNNRLSSFAACENLRSKGLASLMLTATMEGEASQIALMLASIGREISKSDNPLARPASIVVGGETTVTVTGKGKGGRNQELALAAALKICDVENIVIASFSTDGVDGPTDAAGAIADSRTISRAGDMSLNAESFLHENDSYHFFSRINDLILTGQTGTNVNDVTIIIVV